MGFEHLKAPFVAFMIDEALRKKTLSNAARSCKDYWVHILKNDEESAVLLDYIFRLEEEMANTEWSRYDGKGKGSAGSGVPSDIKGKKKDGKNSKPGVIKKIISNVIGKNDK